MNEQDRMLLCAPGAAITLAATYNREAADTDRFTLPADGWFQKRSWSGRAARPSVSGRS
jgi:hypothetical protein